MVSAEQDVGIEELKDAIFNKMNFIRIYLKEVGKKPDMDVPLIMFKGCIIKDVCAKLHKDFVENFRFARVWGKSAKFEGQVFKKLEKRLEDNDILELHIR
jgi:ribosome-interacting GTPase 1